jgi:hypothetical protein
MQRIAWNWIGLVLGLGLGACGAASAPAAGTPTNPGAPAGDVALDARFVETLRGAADAYAGWGRVDERPRAAPELCAAPAPRSSSAGDVRLSSAGVESPHGRKLYYLYAKDRAAYLGLGAAALPIGFTVVKEAFAPRTATGDEVGGMQPYVEHAGEYLVPDAAAGLFVMTKVGGVTEPGTDEGWIYGTIAADGAVTSAGRVATCMGCHVDQAPHERLFGLPRVAE